MWDNWEVLVREKMDAGLRLQTACKQVAKQTGDKWKTILAEMKLRGLG